MRLIKLLAYFSLGYLIYEFYIGMSGVPETSGGGNRSRSQRRSRDLKRALNRDTGRMGNLSGAGRGESVSVEDSQGGRSTKVVGRGVVSG
jgi:hypothetical protein